MSFFTGNNYCDKCGKPLSIFEQGLCVECESKVITTPTVANKKPTLDDLWKNIKKWEEEAEQEPCEDAVRREQWQELKETIIEMRDNDGTGTQQEVCKFLANYMVVLEKQMQEPTYYPPCIDCNKKMDEIRRAYDKLKEQEPCDDAVEQLKKYTHGKKNTDKVEINVLALNRIIKALSQEPCEDAVNRQAVCEIISDIRDCISVEGYCAILERLKKLPSVRPQEPKMWHWIEEIDDYGKVIGWHCDKCYEDSGFTTDCKWSYCPNCGAKMVGSQESEGVE